MTLSSISFCCVLKDEEEYINELINSVEKISVTLKDYELIFVDDFSKDNTFELLKSYKDKNPNIKIIRNPFPGKVSGTNEALKLCTKNYVKFIDGDDMICGDFSTLPEKFECLYHDYHELKKVEKKYVTIGNWLAKSPELIRNDFRSIPKAMFIFKRSYIEEYFPIPKSLPFEDLWINFIASKAKDLKYKNKSFYVYRQHSNQFYGSHSNFNHSKRIRMGNRFRSYYDYLSNNEHPFKFKPSANIKYYSDVLLRRNLLNIINLIRHPRLLIKSILYNFPFLIKFIWNK